MSRQSIAEISPNGSRQDDAGKIPPYAWVILAVTFISSIAAPISQSKVPPVMPVLMKTFNLSLTQAGMLMSVFAITGFILALPAGLIMQRLGIKISGLLATGCLVIGSVLGAFSTSSGLMLSSRVIEGIGMGLMAIVAPATIAMWFPPQKRGVPMGIWAAWVPLGASLMFILAPRMATAFGWQSIWWFSAAYSLLAFMLVLIFMRMPPGLEAGQQTRAISVGNDTLNLKQALSKRDIWLLAATFGLFSLANVSLSTYYPTFLSTVREYSMNSASFISSLSMMTMMFFTPLAGVLADKIRSRKALFTWPIILVAGLMFLPYQVSGMLIPIVMILMGAIGGAVPTAIFSTTPEIMQKPELAGFGLGVISLGQNMGMILGPILFGFLVERLSWITAGYAMIPLLVAGFFVGRAVRVR